MNSKTPAWKRLLKYAYDHCNVVSANEAVACGLVKNLKSLRDMIYRLKKNGYVLEFACLPYSAPDNNVYGVAFTRAGLKVIRELAGINVDEVKPQDNTPLDNSMLADLQKLYNVRFLDPNSCDSTIDLVNMKALGFANNYDDCLEKLQKLESNELIEWVELDKDLFDVNFTLKGFDMLSEAKCSEKLVDVKMTQEQAKLFISTFKQAIDLLEQAISSNK